MGVVRTQCVYVCECKGAALAVKIKVEGKCRKYHPSLRSVVVTVGFTPWFSRSACIILNLLTSVEVLATCAHSSPPTIFSESLVIVI